MTGAKVLVLTHNAADQNGDDLARASIAAHFKGPISFARDLDVF